MKRLVVLIDDHAATNLIHERLIRNSYTPEDLNIFESGREACNFLEKEMVEMKNYDELLILLDMKMPDFDGFELLDILEDTDSDFSERIKVFILTNDHSMRLDEKSTRYKHVQQVIRKPLSNESLRVIMN